MYHDLQKICKTQTRKKTKKAVILISATPFNNRPEDLRNLIDLFQDSHACTLDISLDQFFQQTIQKYKVLKKSLEELEKETPPPSDQEQRQRQFQEELKTLYKEMRQKVMMPLTVRRTRADLTNNLQYKNDLVTQGLQFPDVKLHEPLYYQMNPKLNRLFDESLQAIQKLKYTRWRAVQYLVPDQKDIVQKTDIPSTLLAHLIKVLLIKRLDSSFYSFFQTLQRLKQANQQMLQMYDDNKILIGLETREIENYLSLSADELIDKIEELNQKQASKNIKTYQKKDFENGLEEGLERDQEIFQELIEQWQPFLNQEIDPKFEELVSFLKQHFKKPSHQKIIVFSEATETILYLEKRLNLSKVLAVHSQNRDQLKQTIQVNFDENLEHSKQKDEYQILLATEALAEGVNLHRADTILNYDTPWNAVKLMQRLGTAQSDWNTSITNSYL